MYKTEENWGAVGCWARRGTASKRAGGVHGAPGAGERPVLTWACCWASRLCTWCTQPVLT